MLYLAFSQFGRIPLDLDDEDGAPIPYGYEAGEYISKQEARDLGHADIQEVVDSWEQDA